MTATEAAGRNEYLTSMTTLVGQIASDGFSDAEIRAMLNDALEHIAGDIRIPYGRGACGHCGAVQIGWTEYQWTQLISSACRNCGKLW